jgi:hypothetical protein
VGARVATGAGQGQEVGCNEEQGNTSSTTESPERTSEGVPIGLDGLKLFPPGMCSPKFISIQGLMPFQFHIDTDFVDELSGTVPKAGNIDGSYEFCFRRTPLNEPYVYGKYVTFGSYHANNSHAEPQLSARRVFTTAELRTDPPPSIATCCRCHWRRFSTHS